MLTKLRLESDLIRLNIARRNEQVTVSWDVEGLNDVTHMALAQLEAGWVSVKDKLPTDESKVLICMTPRDLGLRVAYLCRGTEDFWKGWPSGVEYIAAEVTHWMPLPSPPLPSRRERGGKWLSANQFAGVGMWRVVIVETEAEVVTLFRALTNTLVSHGDAIVKNLPLRKGAAMGKSEGEVILKPCPFCGGEAQVITIRNKPVCECRNCGVLAPWAKSNEAAIAAWNTRAVVAKSEVAELVKALEWKSAKEPPNGLDGLDVERSIIIKHKGGREWVGFYFADKHWHDGALGLVPYASIVEWREFFIDKALAHAREIAKGGK